MNPWDVASRKEIATFAAPSISADDTLRLWDLDEQRVTDRLCDAIDGPALRDLWASAIPDLPYSPVC